MRIYIQIKSAGKRRPILEPVPYEIPEQIDDVRGLICEIVKIEVEKYNSKEKDQVIRIFRNYISCCSRSCDMAMGSRVLDI